MRTTTTLLLAVLLLGAAPAGVRAASEASKEEEPLVWSPELQMRFLRIGDLALSSDGSRVAFTVRDAVMDETTSEFRSQVWVARAEGSDSRQYTHRDQSSTAPAFSPDGRFLAFLSKKAGKKSGGAEDEGPTQQIWVMPVDGGEARELTAGEGEVTAFAWSPDGAAVAFLMTDPKTEEEKEAKKEKRDVELVDQDFKYGRLYTLAFDLPGADAQANLLTEADVHVTEFDWSPDGSEIVLRHQPDPTNSASGAGDLSVVDVDTPEMRPFVSWEGDDAQPRWSPDGATVAFVSEGGRAEPVGLGDVYVVSASGGEPRPLAHTPDRSARLVGWSAGSDALWATEARRTTRQLFSVPADGVDVHQISDFAGVLGSPALARDGSTVVFTMETSSTPAEVFVSSSVRFAPRKLTDLHGEVPRPEMGRTELISWTSTDGLEIEGLLTYPVDHRAGERVPLVLNVHGGPAGVYSQNFTGQPSVYMLQTFAQRGYAILRPNPRGSTGYGKEFRYANVRDWCFGDYEDVMSGVDAVIERGVGDPDRLFVMGWSYGGYMTSCVVGRTDRFRAASMGAGLPNLVSMVYTTDIPWYLVAHMGGKELWEDAAEYERHSAQYKLDRIVTPTQIIHGMRDLRVPYAQGREFFIGLRRRGVATEMVAYPRTPHGPREPKFLMDVSPRILTWFERFGGGKQQMAPSGGE